MNKHPQIVSISGLIGSGKDTIGQILVNDFGYTRMSFSSTLKDCVAAIFGFDREMLDGLTPESRAWRETPDPWWTEKLNFGKPMTPRDLIIAFATGTMRNHFHNDIWMLSLERQILHYSGRVVLTDTRHFNELALVRRLGGQVWGVWRRPPAWDLVTFYSGVEDAWRHEAMGAAEPFAVDLSNPNIQAIMTRCGHAAAELMAKPPHESEWQHLLWNDWDCVFANTSHLDALTTMVHQQMALDCLK